MKILKIIDQLLMNNVLNVVIENAIIILCRQEALMKVKLCFMNVASVGKNFNYLHDFISFQINFTE